jgi:antitoxin VapB
MVKTTLFRSNKTQAVRLPKAVALPDDVREVEVTVWGDARLITPADGLIDFGWANGAAVSVDFMAERDQPAPQERVLL